MPESTVDQAALSATLRAQDDVISRAQALAFGMTRSALAHRLRPGGPWQRLLAGVYLTQTGAPNVVQKDMAALLHAGSGSVLTGPAALRGLGITDSEPARFDVLVPNTRRPQSAAFVRIHRTTRMPDRFVSEGGRRYAFPPRALVDTARGMTSPSEVHALIAGAVQRGDCPLPDLVRELPDGRMPNSALLRQALAELADRWRLAQHSEGFLSGVCLADLPYVDGLGELPARDACGRRVGGVLHQETDPLFMPTCPGSQCLRSLRPDP